MERLSAAEVADRLQEDAELHRQRACIAQRGTLVRGLWVGAGFGFSAAEKLVRDHLVPQWQAEPTGDGEYRVEGVERVAWAYREQIGDEAWAIEYIKTDPDTLASAVVWEPLSGRRVCPISGPPSDGKGGA